MAGASRSARKRGARKHGGRSFPDPIPIPIPGPFPLPELPIKIEALDPAAVHAVASGGPSDFTILGQNLNVPGLILWAIGIDEEEVTTIEVEIVEKTFPSEIQASVRARSGTAHGHYRLCIGIWVDDESGKQAIDTYPSNVNDSPHPGWPGIWVD